MNIILEGVDASGKSTLAKELLKHLPGWGYHPSEGPEKEPGEILKRIEHYNLHLSSGCIFDRHPVISHPIYSKTVDWMTDIPYSVTEDFYTRPHLFVFCQPTERGFDAHEENDGEDAKHLAMVKDRYDHIKLDYVSWALRRAQLIYRCGEDFEAVVQRIVRIVS